MGRRARAVTAAMALAVISLGAGASAAPAAPDETPDWARSWLGAWTLAEDGEGGVACGLRLVPGMAIGGAAIEVSATCRRNFPLEDVAGWRLGPDPAGGARSSVVLIDALRRPVLTLPPGPDGSWRGSLPDGRGLGLERGAPTPPRSLRALLGGDATFDLSGPDRVQSCGFTVKATTATNGTITPAGACAARFKGRGWARWSFTQGKLTLRDARGGVLLILSRADPFTFQADVATDMPVFFGPGSIDGSGLLDQSR